MNCRANELQYLKTGPRANQFEYVQFQFRPLPFFVQIITATIEQMRHPVNLSPKKFN